PREPIVPQAERAVLWRAAEVLERQASEVAARLVDRLEGTLYRERKDLTSAELRDQALELVRGVAEALRRGEPEAGGAPWTGAARAHAELRQRQRVPLRDLVREYQMLREELWQALRQHLAAVVPGDVYDLAENLDNALATMVTIATDTYAAEERVFAGLRTANQRLARTYRRLQEASTAVEQGRRTLRTVIDTIPAGVTVTDERGTITLNNPAAESMLGYVEGATAYGWRAGYTLFRADGSPFAHEELPLRRAIERGETSSGVEIYVRLEGVPESVILAGGAPVRDDAGRIVGAVIVFRDITARKRAEEALSRSEAMYRRMVETAQEGVVLVDAEGTITYLNERMAEQLGCASDEMRGRPLMSFVDEESRSAVADLFQKLRRGERDVRDAKFLYPGRGGLWTLVASTPFFEDGRYAGALVMTSDLTEHLRAEEASGRLAAIVESSEDPIVRVELEGTIASWNPAAERLFGYSAQEAVGQPASIIVPPDRLEEIPQILGKIGRGERLRDYET
ncbi:MAG: PAS domain S-box protein, partial [Longimicrobiales bacterium]|nr:PAS domain S-box protein [Longimicrobiales bacterium]